MVIKFSKSKTCLFFPAAPSRVLTKILRSGSIKKSGLWNFISNAPFFHGRKNFPQCGPAVMSEIESFTSIENPDISDFNAVLDDFECLEIDCTGSMGLQRMAVLYQSWAGGDVMLCVQYQGQISESCFLYSNVALNRILQVVQSQSKSSQMQSITEDERTIVAKLPNFPRCTDTPMTVGRSSPLHLNTFQPILDTII
jgi:hypothetical protein